MECGAGLKEKKLVEATLEKVAANSVDIMHHVSLALRVWLTEYDVLQGLKEKKLVEANLEKVDRLKPIAKQLNCSLAQLALAWCLRNEHVSTVITGATKHEQVRGPPLPNCA